MWIWQLVQSEIRRVQRMIKMGTRNSTRWRIYPARQIQQHVRAGPQCKPQGSYWNRRNENGTNNHFVQPRRNTLHTTYQQRIQQSSCKQCGKPCSNSFSNIHMCLAKFASCNKYGNHGLSQQGVWVLFRTPKTLKRTPQDTQYFWGGISRILNLKLIIEFYSLLIIPLALFNDIMPYFDEFIHIYG